MSDCTATGTIRLGDEDIVVICDRGPHSGPEHHDVIHGEWSSSHTVTLCPICLEPAPNGTAAGSAHLATHSREQLIDVIRALSADLRAAIDRNRDQDGSA